MNDLKFEKPKLQNYLSVHHYLEDLYKFRKNTEENFSYEIWARELNIKNRSFLRQIVIGRRSLTSKMTLLLMERLNFHADEKEFFEILVHYSNCRSQRQRHIFGQKLIALMKNGFEQIEISNYRELISSSLHPKILTLLTFKDILKTETSLAKLLDASTAEIQTGIKTLEKLKLIQFDETTQEWKSTENQIKVPDHIGDSALLDYHEQSLKAAIAAKKLSPDHRRYKALILPLSQNEFFDFWNNLQSFAKETLRNFDTDDLKNRRLYQVNLNAHAVSETPEALLE